MPRPSVKNRSLAELLPSPPRPLGTFCVPYERLLHLLRLTDEHYPIHTDRVFALTAPAEAPLVPGVVVWELLRALEASTLGTPAWLAPPTLDADYVRPLRCDEPLSAEEEVLPPLADGRVQLRWRVRRVVDGDVVALALRRGHVRQQGAD